MSLKCKNNLFEKTNIYNGPNFKSGAELGVAAPLTKPIEVVQQTIENSLDVITQTVDGDKKKKSTKTAIAVGSSVFVIAGLVALLNPRYSPKLIAKLKNISYQASESFKQNKNNYLQSKFHNAVKKTVDWTIKTLQFTNNINAAKDLGFKWLCCEKKGFYNVKNKTLKKGFRKVNEGFTYVMSKCHNVITKGFDKISMKTVQGKYKKANAKMNELDSLIQQVKKNLSLDEQKMLDEKLAEILELRKNFSKDSINQRLVQQEDLMANLERDFLSKFRQYRKGFTNKWVDKGDHITSNMSFWAEDILMPVRNKVEAEGVEVLNKLFGNGKNKKGLYDDIFDILNSKMKPEEKKYFSKLLKNADKRTQKANYSERVEYFDKKRDLILGSAPTDIVTALAGLGLSGVAVATADTKEEKLSNLMTKGFPIVAGIGASMAFTAMLFSGVQGLVYGFLTSIGLSKLGSLADHYILGNKDELVKADTAKNDKKETNNV